MRFLISATTLPPRELALAAEALAELLWARLLRPLQSYTRYLHTFGSLCHQVPNLPENPAKVTDVAKAIRRVERHLPGDGTCLLQARAATRMLRRRRIPSILYVGVKRDDKGDMQSHAWVKNGTLFVTGRHGHRQFAVLTMHVSDVAAQYS